MGIIKKLKARHKGEVLMTPLDKVKLFNTASDKKLTKETNKISKEIKETIIEDDGVSYSLELIKVWQEKNPGKHAIWRGKYTKQFIEWADDADFS